MQRSVLSRARLAGTIKRQTLREDIEELDTDKPGLAALVRVVPQVRCQNFAARFEDALRVGDRGGVRRGGGRGGGGGVFCGAELHDEERNWESDCLLRV